MPETRSQSEVDRVTIIIEVGDEVLTYEIPKPFPVQLDTIKDVREDPFAGPLFSKQPVLRLTIPTSDEGYVLYRGREHIAPLLRRIAPNASSDGAEADV